MPSATAKDVRERITFRAYVQVGENEFGELIYEWSEFATVSARVEPLKGDEVVAAAQTRAYHEITFHTRYRSDIEATGEIRWQSRDYDITAWRNLDERKRFLSTEAKAKS